MTTATGAIPLTMTGFSRRGLLRQMHDGLLRREREIPMRCFAAAEDAGLAREPGALIGLDFTATEEQLVTAALPELHQPATPRTIVHVHPSSGSAGWMVLDSARRAGQRTTYIAVSVGGREVAEATGTARRRGVSDTIGIVADITCGDIPLPVEPDRPLLLLCLGNALGRYTRLDAIRLLRAARGIMGPGDSLLLAVDARTDHQAISRAVDARSAALAEGQREALAALATELELELDVAGFDVRTRYDAENRRVETRLVARSAQCIELPGVVPIHLRKGESVRTGISSTFSRGALGGMLRGAGLRLRWWRGLCDGFALVLARPARDFPCSS